MKPPARLTMVLAVVGLSFLWFGCVDREGEREGVDLPPLQADGYTGSVSCRECHETFYQLWAPSHHGLAMQPFTSELARKELVTTSDDITIGENRYGVEFDDESGWVREDGPTGASRYRIEQVLGGKNVYYFLTPMERGRLQVLPLAFDVHEREWFAAMESMVRHFDDVEDAALEWTDRLLTFNTACYSCHVSQLSTSYDLETDSYQTVWAEPGINCESCHGPAEEHIRLFRALPEGARPDDPKIIAVKDFTVGQLNASCAPCHAKMYPLTNSFRPGDRYLDHFDLSTLEHPDFYPDGRDLGENYTYTLWLTSPCLRSGDLGCLHCHTSSGRYLFVDEPNDACLPCHENKVTNPAAHTRHLAGSTGSECVACHMPQTTFARMVRSDHSMRPPTPSVTLEFGSPNACNLCHGDRDAAWADRWVREWRDRDYQAPVLQRTRLIDAGRRGDWSLLPAMLEYVRNEKENEVYRASLLRLLMESDDPRKWPAILEALKDPSPLVRANAAAALGGYLNPETVPALLEAAGDEFRLVRVNAAEALAGFSLDSLSDDDRPVLERATAEYVAANEVRPDRWSGHFSLGNFYMHRGELEQAVAAYERAHKLEPRAVAPLVNVAIAYNMLGNSAGSEEALRRALEVEPDHPTANLSLGLLLGEQGRMREAEAAFRSAMESRPDALAAYNLCVLLSAERIEEAVGWCRSAVELQPEEPEYAYTLGFYLHQNGDTDDAIRVLAAAIEEHPTYADAYLLLGGIYRLQRNLDEAEAVYLRGLSNEGVSGEARQRLESELRTVRADRRGDP